MFERSSDRAIDRSTEQSSDRSIGQWPSVVDKGAEKVDKGGEKVAPEETKKKKKTSPSVSKKNMVSANVPREPGGTFVNLGWWNRSGHSGPFIFKTRNF